MNLYARYLLPRLLDWAMADDTFSRHREALLADVTGETLEIGFGTGLNLLYYPPHLQKLTAIDANPGMSQLAERRIRASNISVDHQVLNGENLAIADNSFDSVVSTWTLCSITNVEKALREIYRVLKPKGQFFFVEHGLSRDPQVQIWQRRLTPIQKVIADGCHLDRNIQQLIENQFDDVTLTQFKADGLSPIVGCFYRGIAFKY